MARQLYINGTKATNVKDKTGSTMWKVVDGNDSPDRAVWFEEPHFDGMSFADNQGIVANNETVTYPPPFSGAIAPQNYRGFAAAVEETNPAKQSGYAWYDTVNGRWLGWTYCMWWCRASRRIFDSAAVAAHMICTPWTDGLKVKWSATHTLDPVETGGIGHGVILVITDGASFQTSANSRLSDGVTSGSGYFVIKLNTTGTNIMGLADPLNNNSLYYNNAIYANKGSNDAYMLRLTEEPGGSGDWYLRFYYSTNGTNWQYKTDVTSPGNSDYNMALWNTQSSAKTNAIKVTIGSSVQRAHAFDGIASDGIDHSW